VLRTVIFYRTAEGRCPVEEFLDSLDNGAARKATWVLGLLEELPMVPPRFFKKLAGSDNIWECRASFRSNAYRILCFFAGNSIVVLTHGFMKKSQKTPREEILRAETMRRDFLERRKSHE
jgi:phage-related protein